MSKRAKHICVVLVAQAGCLMVGLWMQYQFVRSSSANAAMDAAWSQLENTTTQVTNLVTPDDLSKIRPPSELNELLTLRIQAMGGAHTNVLILDKQWRVVWSIPNSAGTSQAFPPGTKVDWVAVPEEEETQPGIMFGRLDVADQPHVAVAKKWHHGGYVVAHQSQEEVMLTAAMLLKSHFAITGLTLVWTIALLSFSAYMVLARFHDQVERERSRANAEDLRQRQKLIRTRDAVIFGLAKLADSRDPETGDHLERISVYATTLASTLRRHSKYKDIITPGFLRLIGISSALHDIGKVGIEDGILLKPGDLTEAERERMQLHPAIGGECLREIEYRLGSSNFLQMAREIAFSHHENWDGSGYPCGLKGEEIPLAARIVAIVDVYDALSSRRVYKDAYEHEKCVDIIKRGSGKQFDADLVDVWVSVAPRFEEIAAQYASVRQPALQSSMLPGDASVEDHIAQDNDAQEMVLTTTEENR